MNIAQALERAALLVDSDSSQLDVQLLLCDALQCARSYLFTWPERELTGAQLERFDACFTRRLGGEPIAYILGYQDFWTLRLAVSPATLIPRPDTELLVEAALDLGAEQGLKVADLGTGTGAVALALASERPAWRIVACDIKPEACELAERNRIACALENVEVRSGSWCAPLQERFDMIVSNPPYIEADDEHLLRGDVRFEPDSALVSGDSGLDDIAFIIQQSRDYLVDGGWLLLEHGWRQAEAVRGLLNLQGFNQVKTLSDLAGNERVTLGCYTRARDGGINANG